MSHTVSIVEGSKFPRGRETGSVLAIIQEAGPDVWRGFLEFFTAHIYNRHTRDAYARAVRQFFGWLHEPGMESLLGIQPVHVATWVELKTQTQNPQTVKQHLAVLKCKSQYLICQTLSCDIQVG